MFELTVEVSFSAAHCIRGHPGRCAQLHGHNYRVVVTVSSERLNEQGLVVDFAELKRICQEVVDPLDHTLLNDLPAFATANPTAEALARHVYQAAAQALAAAALAAVRLARVTVYESERAYATYWE
jgi:6-pyruvoyltetrahydropterin/6-carboxytetrahydropterin synthase